MKQEMREQTYDNTNIGASRVAKDEPSLKQYHDMYRSFQRHNNTHLLSRLIDHYARAFLNNSFQWLDEFDHDNTFATIEIIENILKDRGMRLHWTGLSWELVPMASADELAQCEIPF